MLNIGGGPIESVTQCINFPIFPFAHQQGGAGRAKKYLAK